jgi:anthranilate 1,2-dioxygenase small subunit
MDDSVLTRDRLPDPPSLDSRLEALLLHHEIESFNARYAQALDEQRLADWTEMFTDDARYVIVSRENFDRGLPVG